MNAAAAIDIEALQFGWDRRKAPLLHVERLTVLQGERVFLQGPSGSGKSTLLNLISGVLVPDAGSVRLLGKPLTQLSASERDAFRGEHMGFIFQMFNLIPYLTMLENVMLPAQLSRKRRGRIAGGALREEALRLLGALGLSDSELANRRVTQLSIGQQQRVAAARALLGRPEIVIADEPTSALDADNREDFLRLLMDECRMQGTTVLFVSHDVSLGARFDRTLAMNDISRAAAQAA